MKKKFNLCFQSCNVVYDEVVLRIESVYVLKLVMIIMMMMMSCVNVWFGLVYFSLINFQLHINILRLSCRY